MAPKRIKYIEGIDDLPKNFIITAYYSKKIDIALKQIKCHISTIQEAPTVGRNVVKKKLISCE